MPAVPIIAAVASVPAAIGAAAASAVGLGTVSAVAATAIGSGIISGGITAVRGGDISDVLESAVIGGAASFVGGTVANAVGNTVASATGSKILGSAAGNVAGTLASGGSSQEALTSGLLGGIGAGIDDMRLAAADEYLDSLPGGYGDYSDLPPDMSDFDVPFTSIDTTFTPDYSLSTGAPVIPDMGAQGIQVPTINEVIDVVNQPVDYSLPVPDSGLGLQVPTLPNLDAMGGGQGITTPVDGGTLTEAGVIPDSYTPVLGDSQSFVNQPAPEVNVNIPELTPSAPKNIDTELALLDLAKSAAPYVVGGLVADRVMDENAQSGFRNVPIPGDWRSPQANQGFIPSAPIDFGSRDLLIGTQWENRPMDVSTLINVLNSQQTQAPQFDINQVVGNIGDTPMSINDIINNIGQNPMQPFDMNQTIGQLNNAPASLNSIIAGIQSQYG